MLEDEKIFDFKIKRKHSDKGFVFTLGQGNVIKGWDQVYRVLDHPVCMEYRPNYVKGLMDMCIGEQRMLTIPSDLGYGQSGYPPVIPPNATLKFHVILSNISRKGKKKN